MDATRSLDNVLVCLKRIARDVGQHQRNVRRHLVGQAPTDPRNHCVPVFQTLVPPHEEERYIIIVMPFLRPLDNPSFETVGEVVDCIDHLIEEWTNSDHPVN